MGLSGRRQGCRRRWEGDVYTTSSSCIQNHRYCIQADILSKATTHQLHLDPPSTIIYHPPPTCQPHLNHTTTPPSRPSHPFYSPTPRHNPSFTLQDPPSQTILPTTYLYVIPWGLGVTGCGFAVCPGPAPSIRSCNFLTLLYLPAYL